VLRALDNRTPSRRYARHGSARSALLEVLRIGGSVPSLVRARHLAGVKRRVDAEEYAEACGERTDLSLAELADRPKPAG
jgi:hypothetical protein